LEIDRYNEQTTFCGDGDSAISEPKEAKLFDVTRLTRWHVYLSQHVDLLAKVLKHIAMYSTRKLSTKVTNLRKDVWCSRDRMKELRKLSNNIKILFRILLGAFEVLNQITSVRSNEKQEQ